MSDIHPGVTFHDSDSSYTLTASADTLHNFLASASVVNASATEHAGSAYVIMPAMWEPSPKADQDERTFWFDLTNKRFKQRTHTFSYHDWVTRYGASRNTTDDHPQGSVMVAEGSFLADPCVTAEYPHVVGIVDQDYSAVFTRRDLIKFGLVEVLCEGPFGPGDHLISSSNTGFAKSSTSLSPLGNFTAGISFGMFLYSGAPAFSGLVTCFVWL